MKTTYPITTVLDTLDAEFPSHPMGELTQGQPFKVLVACIMSLRTKDDLTIPLAAKLFEKADTPQSILKLGEEKLTKAIYPVGFYKTKAKNIIKICQILIDEYQSQVPKEIDDLLTLPNVGRKTANLVRGLGHGLPAVCVDIHVHRICQRLGFLKDMKDPDTTEMAIRKKLPEPYWHVINRVMVMHGQTICKPIGPLCHQCPIEQYCKKVDVKPRKQK